ncbi:diguanylate cyclase [Pseudoalteromonas shioyasakiensis]|uniref:diguanylate cyclase n=1 Tax=Pseudoalteromonas shioyasakiensis TaxID=1190813 RepID=UPI002119776B|nr:diguanylate cyclase [Pseudoalteromonas shioyasakiensis]MCQ8878878.1 diguanylate cyclase [Pseudoalteromonas shioyasakiensis]
MTNVESEIAQSLIKSQVLIVDDQAINISLLQKILSNHYQLTTATSGEQALEICKTQSPDLILLDIEMAGINGIETCKRLKSTPETKDIPIIFITSFEQHEDLCWQVGGVDFISKPINQTTVFNRVKVHLTLKLQRDKLLDMVYLDSLTQVYNRRYFDSHLIKTELSAKREGGDYTIILIDIDFFKQFNDIYGHLKGDEALRDVAQAIMHTLLRPSDFVARYGGEEFAVILPFTDLKGGILVAENIRKNISALNISHSYNTSKQLTVSAGIATLRGIIEQENVLKSADEKLYMSKQTGRNKITY